MELLDAASVAVVDAYVRPGTARGTMFGTVGSCMVQKDAPIHGALRGRRLRVTEVAAAAAELPNHLAGSPCSMFLNARLPNTTRGSRLLAA